MTNPIAFALAAIIAALVAADLLVGWGGTLFLARQFVVFVDWLAFWR